MSLPDIYAKIDFCHFNHELATGADFQKATQKVYFGDKNASMIVLPITGK